MRTMDGRAYERYVTNIYNVHDRNLRTSHQQSCPRPAPMRPVSSHLLSLAPADSFVRRPTRSSRAPCMLSQLSSAISHTNLRPNQLTSGCHPSEHLPDTDTTPHILAAVQAMDNAVALHKPRLQFAPDHLADATPSTMLTFNRYLLLRLLSTGQNPTADLDSEQSIYDNRQSTSKYPSFRHLQTSTDPLRVL